MLDACTDSLRAGRPELPLMGLGAGATIGLAWAMTGDVEGRRHRVRAALVAAAVVAAVAGAVGTAALSELASWRLAFLAVVPLALLAAALAAAAGIVLLGLRLGAPTVPHARVP